MRAVFFLTLGTAVSVAVAWLQPIWNTWVGRPHVREVRMESWPIEFSGPHGPPTSVLHFRSVGSSGLVATRDEAGADAAIWTYVRHTKGIPFHCVGCEMWGSFSPRQGMVSSGSLYAASPTLHMSGYTYAPIPESLRRFLHVNQIEILYRPQWIGLAADALIWGAGLAAICQVPVFLMRRVRRGRGLCPRCGYAAGGSAVCSECGTARS